MSLETGRRGRPKGTGIDDRDHLREIAAMIQEDPDLKPTTAIKKMGFSDPSTIRRLRDKFNSEKEELLREFSGSGTTAKKGQFAHPMETGMREMALNHRREPSISEDTDLHGEPCGAPAAIGPDRPAIDSRSRPVPPDGEALLRSFIALGVVGTSTAAQFHAAIARQFMMTPFFYTALRLQIAATRAMFDLGEPQLARRSAA